MRAALENFSTGFNPNSPKIIINPKAIKIAKLESEPMVLNPSCWLKFQGKINFPRTDKRPKTITKNKLIKKLNFNPALSFSSLKKMAAKKKAKP